MVVCLFLFREKTFFMQVCIKGCLGFRTDIAYTHFLQRISLAFALFKKIITDNQTPYRIPEKRQGTA